MTTTKPPHILIVQGPTASGKSGLALRAATTLNGEIIGADSVQIYKHLDIGSAKASLEDRAKAPHHLVDHLELTQDYDAGDFQKDADALIQDISSRGKLPILCGGTGLYIRTLLYGMSEAPPSDENIRAALRERIDAEGSPALHQELAQIDPTTAHKVHPNDRVRVVRALEVYQLTGKTMSALQAEHRVKERPPRYRALQIALDRPREELYQRINKRVAIMMKEGMVEEVQNLLAMGYAPSLKPLGSLGYRQIIAWLQNDARDPKELTELIRRDHRRYAKRQLTWLRGQPNLSWVKNPEEGWQKILAIWGESEAT